MIPTPAAAPPPAAPAGILLPIVMAAMSGICFSFTDMLSKMLAANLPALEVAWGRAVMSGLLAAAMLGGAGILSLRHTPRLPLGLLRGLISAVIPVLAVWSLDLLPMALFTAIIFMSPVLMTVLSVPILGERVGPRRWVAVVVGFVAVAIIVQPAGEGFGWAVALPIGCAVLNAFYPILTRLTAPGMSPAALLAFGPGLAAVFLTLAVPFVWVTPSWPDALLLLGCGVVHAFSHLLVVRAYSAAPASVLAPFAYVQMPFAVLAGYLAFNELPSATTVIGGALLVGAGIYIAYREHRLSRIGHHT
ncbi:MAG: DMT family transporter [Alphaproteobacteria bacterium]